MKKGDFCHTIPSSETAKDEPAVEATIASQQQALRDASPATPRSADFHARGCHRVIDPRHYRSNSPCLNNCPDGLVRDSDSLAVIETVHRIFSLGEEAGPR